MSLSDWPTLADVQIPPATRIHFEPKIPGGWARWHGYRYPEESGCLEVAVPGSNAGDPAWQYAVELRAGELGALLGCMPPQAVSELIGAFVQAADPELLGELAGCIIAHVAKVAGSRGEAGA
jgi:hypothetical protein